MESVDSIKGKRFLITSFSYALYGGAELNAVELADQIVEYGGLVDFFSYDIDGPLREYIEDRFSTKILTDNFNMLAEDEASVGGVFLDINKYDYIWIGGNTLPISIIKQINTAKELPHFIFIHMSPLIGFPLDAPLMPDFEKMISSAILSISERTDKDCIYRTLGQDIPLVRWSNPTPREFSELKKRKGELKKIAVISSSHPTDEIINLKNEFGGSNISIDYIGKYNNNMKKVDAAFYDEYDLIIGIGKNVKYSLVSGVPVYVYGRFGGSGYINDINYSLNNKHNFSGRGFEKKDSSTIVNEITKGYLGALKFHDDNRDKFIRQFSIDILARKLFNDISKKPRKDLKIDKRQINWLISSQINIAQRLQTSSSVRNLVETLGVREAEIIKLNSIINQERHPGIITSLKRLVKSLAYKAKILKRPF